MLSLAQTLREVREELEGHARYQDLALALRRAKDRSTLLFAGGKWDRLERRFCSEEPEQVAVIDLEESQVEFTAWFCDFLADFREGYPRDVSAALAAGDRRAGKTFDAYFCQWAALVDVPILPSTGMPAIGWSVSKTYRERDELDQLVAAYIPREWYRPSRAPEHRYDLVHGSVLRNLSADDPDSLKQGVVDWLLYNEGQKMPARAVVNGLYGTADRAGLCVIACNKPSAKDSRGEWLFDLREAIEDEKKIRGDKKKEPLGIKFFGFSSKQNTKIDQPARKRVGRIAAIIDPTTAEADDDDGLEEWKRPGDKAAWEYDKHRHLHKPPAIGKVKNITREVATHAEWGNWDEVGGIDFQSKPHIITEIIRCYGDPEKPIYHFVDEHLYIDKNATEELFLETFEERLGDKYVKESFLWICDNSSTWQGAKHDFEGGERPSAEVFEGLGWTIVGAQAAAKSSRTGRGRNPNVDERLQLFNELLRQDRIRVDPDRCPWLVECLREATTTRKTGRRRLENNQFSHAIDAATYPIWRLEPRTNSSRPSPGEIRIVNVSRRGDSW